MLCNDLESKLQRKKRREARFTIEDAAQDRDTNGIDSRDSHLKRPTTEPRPYADRFAP